MANVHFVFQHTANCTVYPKSFLFLKLTMMYFETFVLFVYSDVRNILPREKESEFVEMFQGEYFGIKGKCKYDYREYVRGLVYTGCRTASMSWVGHKNEKTHRRYKHKTSGIMVEAATKMKESTPVSTPLRTENCTEDTQKTA